MVDRSFFALTALAALSVLVACGDDDVSRDGGTNDARDGSVPWRIFGARGSLTGLVVDVAGHRIAGATVQTGALTVETDARGEFDFATVEARENATLIVTRNGYSTGRIRLTVFDAFPNHVRVTLQRAEIARLLDPAEGGEVRTESGVTFKLAPNQVVDDDGRPVTSPVDIVVALINDRDEMRASPGGMMALDPDAAGRPPTQLESFGMVEISMHAGNERAKLRDDSEVELSFPLAAHHPFDQGDTMSLWHFDEQAELWNHEGKGAVSAQNQMTSLVDHFSWWNAGQIMTKTCVLGRVLDASGRPLGGARLSAEGRSYLGSSYTATGADGGFCLEARADAVVDVRTLVRVGSETQAIAMRVQTPSTRGECGQPSTCFTLPDDLVAVAPDQLCDPALCPVDPAGKEACCISDLGPCSFVVNGDCGGDESSAWNAPSGEPGLAPIPGVPTAPPPMSTTDAGAPGMDASVSDAGGTVDASVDASLPAPDASAGAGGASGQGGDSGSPVDSGQGGTSGQSGEGGVDAGDAATAGIGGASG